MSWIIPTSAAKRRGILRFSGASLALALLAACGSATVFEPYRTVDDLDSFLGYAAPMGQAQLDIVGEPFPIARQELEKAVLQGFDRGVWYGPPLVFSTDSKTARPGYRFRLIFGAGRKIPAESLCADPPPRPSPSPVARLVFCVNGAPYSEVAGQPGANGGDLVLWARNMMRALTPPPDQKVVPWR